MLFAETSAVSLVLDDLKQHNTALFSANYYNYRGIFLKSYLVRYCAITIVTKVVQRFRAYLVHRVSLVLTKDKAFPLLS